MRDVSTYWAAAVDASKAKPTSSPLNTTRPILTVRSSRMTWEAIDHGRQRPSCQSRGYPLPWKRTGPKNYSCGGARYTGQEYRHRPGLQTSKGIEEQILGHMVNWRGCVGPVVRPSEIVCVDSDFDLAILTEAFNFCLPWRPWTGNSICAHRFCLFTWPGKTCWTSLVYLRLSAPGRAWLVRMFCWEQNYLYSLFWAVV